MRQRASQRVWLFDLDNTLHNASHAIFPQINLNMNAYIARLLGDAGKPADEATVNALRLDYYLRYGVTMMGLVRHHGVQAEEFLQHAHTFHDLPSMIRSQRGLARLRTLPGKKILLTNAPAHYSRRVLMHLNLHRQFMQRIPVEQMRVHGKLQPKPSRPFLRKFLAKNRLRASQCIWLKTALIICGPPKRKDCRQFGYTATFRRAA
jgi:putative hydrolase of the HAD superfamily